MATPRPETSATPGRALSRSQLETWGQCPRRWYLTKGAHEYVSPKRGRASHIEAFDIVLREEHIEQVTAPEAENEMPTATVRTCRGCGCTDEEGCDNGCWWVEADLCSNCVGAPAAVTESEVAHAG